MDAVGKARSEGRFADAAELWRAQLRARPHDWQAALELKRDLASGYHYSESDPLFRRAARAFPDDVWLAHYAGLFTFHTADLAWLARRATALLSSRPNDGLAHRVLADVRLQQRRWAAAARHLARADPSAETDSKLAMAQLYLRLAPALAADAPAYEALLINLDGNASRRIDIMREFRASHAPIVRVPGVLGGLLPTPAVARLGGDPNMRGTLGCFLSHASAWATVLARGLAHALIIEDDVVPLLPLPAGLGALGLPADYDVCFVNDRLQPRWPAARIASAERFTAVPFAQSFATFPPEDNAPGGDGYLVSAAGARTLLDWVAEDGFGHDVDWRLVAYSLTPADVAALPPHSHAFGVLRDLAVARPQRLSAYALHPALIRTVPISSDREDENRRRGTAPG